MHHERVVHAQHPAEIAGAADQALHVGPRVVRGLADVPAGQPQLLGGQQAEMDPAHQVGEALVAVAHQRAERLLADHLGQDHVLGGVGLGRARGREAGDVGGEGVAAAGGVCADHFLQPLDHHGAEIDVVGARPVGEVLFRGGAGLHADRRAVQFARAAYAEACPHHEALAVEEGDGREIQPSEVSRERGPGGVAGEDVHSRRLQVR